MSTGAWPAMPHAPVPTYDSIWFTGQKTLSDIPPRCRIVSWIMGAFRTIPGRPLNPSAALQPT
jgi:hypothetical protein